MQLQINGRERDIIAGDVAALLQELGLDASRVAVELNRAIVLSANFAQTPLSAGDSIEIVQFVGGG
ncbi:MAG: sulfur carrier protein ThiS [Desulfuromonadales bacterium]|nr:sulfur carrier protein ThiS [Desulfuromonadales bacterium]